MDDIINIVTGIKHVLEMIKWFYRIYWFIGFYEFMDFMNFMGYTFMYFFKDSLFK